MKKIIYLFISVVTMISSLLASNKRDLNIEAEEIYFAIYPASQYLEIIEYNLRSIKRDKKEISKDIVELEKRVNKAQYSSQKYKFQDFISIEERISNEKKFIKGEYHLLTPNKNSEEIIVDAFKHILGREIEFEATSESIKLYFDKTGVTIGENNATGIYHNDNQIMAIWKIKGLEKIEIVIHFKQNEGTSLLSYIEKSIASPKPTEEEISKIKNTSLTWISSLNPFKQFQNDADFIRLEHLVYWSGLIEKYHKKRGYYPFQNRLKEDNEIGLVRIATKFQQRYFDKSSKIYMKNFDNNIDDSFREFRVKDFILEIEKGLEISLDERYDLQKIPTDTPIGYNYFVSDKGYLLWVTCKTCKVTPISTLLMDGITPTVNIVSPEMKEHVTKSLTREELLAHPIYRKWMARKVYKLEYMRKLEKKLFRDSKE